MKFSKLNFAQLLIFLLSGLYTVNAQNVGVNNTTPDPSAVLDIKSNNKGVLVPRMTSIEREAISGAVDGLLVFDSISNSFWYYNDIAWNEISKKFFYF